MPEKQYIPWRRDIVDYHWKVSPIWWNPWTWRRPRWVKMSHLVTGCQ